MPYIPATSRAPLDSLIDQLAEAIVGESQKSEQEAAFAGLLNYSFTRLALKVLQLRFGAIRYWLIATTVGVFQNASDEFYRRVGIPYEDKQISKNGDVDLYGELGKEL